MATLNNESRFETRAIHAGQPPESNTGAVIPPIFQTSTYAQRSPGEDTGYVYGRGNNPTRTAYQDCLASLENAKYALAFSSGVAATHTVLQTLSPGDHVICCDDVYGGTFRLFDKVFKSLGIEFSYVDLTDIELAKNAIRPETKLMWMESPTNPLLKIFDIDALCSLCKA